MWPDKCCCLYLQNISRIYPFTPAGTRVHTTILSLLGLLLQSLLLQSVLSTAARVILWKCDCAAALFKLSNGCFSCSVKAWFSTLVYKVPHTLAPPLPGLAPCTPFLTLFIGWAPLFREVPSPLPSLGLLTCHSLWLGTALPLVALVWPTPSCRSLFEYSLIWLLHTEEQEGLANWR